MRRLQLAIIAGIILFLIYLSLLWLGGSTKSSPLVETKKDRDVKELPLPAIKTEIPVNKTFYWQTEIGLLPQQAAVYSMDIKRPTLEEAQKYAKSFGFEDFKNQITTKNFYIFDRTIKSGFLDRMIVNQNQNPTITIWWAQKIDGQKNENVGTTTLLSNELIENLDKNNQKLLTALNLDDHWKIALGSKVFLKNESEGAGFTSLEKADSVRFNYNYNFDNWPIYGQNYGFPIKITYDKSGILKELVVEYIPSGYQMISDGLKTKDNSVLVSDLTIKPLFAISNSELISGNWDDFKPEKTTILDYQLGYLYNSEKRQLWPYVFFDAEAAQKEKSLKLLLGTSLIL